MTNKILQTIGLGTISNILFYSLIAFNIFQLFADSFMTKRNVIFLNISVILLSAVLSYLDSSLKDKEISRLNSQISKVEGGIKLKEDRSFKKLNLLIETELKEDFSGENNYLVLPQSEIYGLFFIYRESSPTWKYDSQNTQKINNSFIQNMELTWEKVEGRDIEDILRPETQTRTNIKLSPAALFGLQILLV